MSKDITAKKVGRVIYIYIALFLCIVFALSVATLSKSSITKDGTDSAKIAAFLPGNFSLDFTLDKISPDSSSATYDFSVKNFDSLNVSAVDMSYTITLGLYGDLPLNLSLFYVTEVDGTEVLQELVGVDGVYSAPVVFLGGRTATHQYKIAVEWAEGATDLRYTDEISCLNVKITTKQID